jgi:hypothetical protein
MNKTYKEHEVRDALAEAWREKLETIEAAKTA